MSSGRSDENRTEMDGEKKPMDTLDRLSFKFGVLGFDAVGRFPILVGGTLLLLCVGISAGMAIFGMPTFMD